MLKIADQPVGCAAGADIFEPDEGGSGLFVLLDIDLVAVIEPGIVGQLRLVVVELCIFKMKAQVCVDVEGEVQNGGAPVDEGGGSVRAEDFHLGTVGVPGLDLIDQAGEESAVVQDISILVAVVFISGADKKPEEVIHLVRDQKVSRVLMGCASVVDDIESIHGKDQVKVLENTES